jgi:hypothetical protein
MSPSMKAAGGVKSLSGVSVSRLGRSVCDRHSGGLESREVPSAFYSRSSGPADDVKGPADQLANEFPVLAEIVGASVQGRVALGSRAGARVRRLGDARDTAAGTSRGSRQAHLEGIDLHANV